MPSEQSKTLRPRPSASPQEILPLETQRLNWENEALQTPLPSEVQWEALTGEISGERLWTSDRPAGTVLYLHGGGFTQGSSKTHRPLAALLTQATGWQVITLDYPLAPEHPFPAALHFVVKAYTALLQSTSGPVVLGGDSAGGQLVLSGLLLMQEQKLPLPAGAFLISPWLDLTQSGASMQSRAALDPMVTQKGLQDAADAYLQGVPATDPLASPLFSGLQHLPPLLCLVGDHEVLLSDSERLAAFRPETTALKVHPDMWHVWPAWGPALPEALEALQDIQGFLLGLSGESAL
ncbi:alpha/beta hydrolase [Deinococcus roseus]|uniref:Alpha/beta hydrolase fold-3 domain-containing protein n=1 Tax=Deinococcus roseus TaxID=392414 RepID=A0ABQ2DDA5_9DEIO|nr:alpha/beta hydrolase [Deinococcus roseus]GGJ53831.1 hypothetical protein GCM10008938_44800 [Deinococcus roseus]